jgi:nucleotide-binding universal stress UspA family protein
MKILVPTDFSENADRAIDYAVKMAGRNGAEIILLHAYKQVKTVLNTGWAFYEEYNSIVAQNIHEELNLLRDKIAGIYPGTNISAEFMDDDIRSAIEKAGRDRDIDLIVMGTQGASCIKKVLMGSVTASLISYTTVPVLAIPRLYQWKEPKIILLASNQFETDPGILTPVLKVARLFNAKLHMLVFTDTDSANEAEILQQKENLEKSKTALEKTSKDIQFTSANLKGSEFEETLQQYIDINHIDMLAMITHKKGFWEAVFNNRLTRKMAFRSSIPLLAIPGNHE